MVKMDTAAGYGERREVPMPDDDEEGAPSSEVAEAIEFMEEQAGAERLTDHEIEETHRSVTDEEKRKLPPDAG
jgi:hypothetical protein